MTPLPQPSKKHSVTTLPTEILPFQCRRFQFGIKHGIYQFRSSHRSYHKRPVNKIPYRRRAVLIECQMMDDIDREVLQQSFHDLFCRQIPQQIVSLYSHHLLDPHPSVRQVMIHKSDVPHGVFSHIALNDLPVVSSG